jgi:hypothetical protein
VKSEKWSAAFPRPRDEADTVGTVERCLACEAEGVATQIGGCVQSPSFKICRRLERLVALAGKTKLDGPDRIGLASEATLHGCRRFLPGVFLRFPKKIAQLSKFFSGLGVNGARRFLSTAWRTTAEQETQYAKSTQNKSWRAE